MDCPDDLADQIRFQAHKGHNMASIVGAKPIDFSAKRPSLNETVEIVVAPMASITIVNIYGNVDIRDTGGYVSLMAMTGGSHFISGVAQVDAVINGGHLKVTARHMIQATIMNRSTAELFGKDGIMGVSLAELILHASGESTGMFNGNEIKSGIITAFTGSNLRLNTQMYPGIQLFAEESTGSSIIVDRAY